MGYPVLRLRMLDAIPQVSKMWSLMVFVYQMLLNILLHIFEWHLSFQIISQHIPVFSSSMPTSIPFSKWSPNPFGNHLGRSPMSQLQGENCFHCKALPRNCMRRLLARCYAHGLLSFVIRDSHKPVFFHEMNRNGFV